MNKIVDTFIALLRSAMTGTKEEIDLAAVDYEALFSLSKFHDLAHIIYYELERKNAPRENEVLQKFKQQYDCALARHAYKDIAISHIRTIFEAAGFPFVFLNLSESVL